MVVQAPPPPWRRVAPAVATCRVVARRDASRGAAAAARGGRLHAAVVCRGLSSAARAGGGGHPQRAVGSVPRRVAVAVEQEAERGGLPSRLLCFLQRSSCRGLAVGAPLEPAEVLIVGMTAVQVVGRCGGSRRRALQSPSTLLDTRSPPVLAGAGAADFSWPVLPPLRSRMPPPRRRRHLAAAQSGQGTRWGGRRELQHTKQDPETGALSQVHVASAGRPRPLGGRRSGCSAQEAGGAGPPRLAHAHAPPPL